MVFSKDLVTLEEILAVLNPAVVSDKNPELGDRYVEVHSNVMTKVLPEVLGSLQKEDNEFLRKFLQFCIAEDHIAHKSFHENFKITVEFNFDEMEEISLPDSHTCVNVLKLPGQAYEGDAETMKKNLKLAVEECHESFQMA